MSWGQAGRGFAQPPSLTHALHVYMCQHANIQSCACIHMFFYSIKACACVRARTHTHTHSHTCLLLVSEHRQPIISFNPFIMFLFSFPLVWGGEKVNANRNSGIQRKTHSLRLRKQEQGIFGKRRDTRVLRVRLCASLFGKEKRGGIVRMIVLHTCVCECVVCVVSSTRWSVDRGGHLSVSHGILWGQTAANNCAARDWADSYRRRLFKCLHTFVLRSCSLRITHASTNSSCYSSFTFTPFLIYYVNNLNSTCTTTKSVPR